MFWKFGERISAQGVSFIVSVILSRLLLPEDFGTVALVLIFISIAAVFTTSGFSTALVQDRHADSVDFSTNFYCSLAVSVLIYGVMFLIAPFLSDFFRIPELTLIIRVFSLRIPLSAYSSIQHAYVERNMLFRRFFFSTLIGTVVSGAVGIILAYCGFGVWALIVQYFTNTVIDIAVLSITIPWHPELRFSAASAKRMMRYGWKVFAADLSGTLFDQLRSFLVGGIFTSSDLAFYNKGKQIPDLISVNVGSSVMTVLFPALANVNDNKEQVKLMTRRAASLLSYIMFPMFTGLAVVAEPLIITLFSEKWSESIIFLRILSISAVISVVSSISLQIFKAIGRSDTLLFLEVLKKPVYLILLIIGINIDTVAVAVTLMIYNIYSSAVNCVYLKKLTGYTFAQQFSDIAGALIMSVSMGAVVWLISFLPLGYPLILTIQIVTGTAYYFAVSVLTHNRSYMYLMDIYHSRKMEGNKL